MHCVACEADLDDTTTIAGAGAYDGQLVHLLDTGPRHSDLMAHPVKHGTRYHRPLPAVAYPVQTMPDWVAHTEPLTDPAGVVLWADVSAWQGKPADATYTRPVLSYRVSLSTTTTDAQAAANQAFAVASGLTGMIGYHVWYPGNAAGQVAYYAAINAKALADPRSVIMLDVETWSGTITGDHSAELNDLATRMLALVGGNQKRVKRYGNSGDLAKLWPSPLAWIGTVKAGYSATAPVEPWDGWQYTDGSTTWPVPLGWPRASAPWGAVDHNAMYGTPADWATAYGVTLGGFLDTLTPQQQQQVYDAVVRSNYGLDQGGTVPFSQRGEIAQRLRSVDANVVALIGAVNGLPGNVAAAVVAALPAGGGGGGLTDAQVQTVAAAAGQAVTAQLGKLTLAIVTGTPAAPAAIEAPAEPGDPAAAMAVMRDAGARIGPPMVQPIEPVAPIDNTGPYAPVLPWPDPLAGTDQPAAADPKAEALPSQGNQEPPAQPDPAPTKPRRRRRTTEDQ